MTTDQEINVEADTDTLLDRMAEEVNRYIAAEPADPDHRRCLAEKTITRLTRLVAGADVA